MSLRLTIAQLFQRAILGYEVRTLTFSQAGEDLVIRNYFYERLNAGMKGFFVDIGAFHPYRESNTYYLYRAGWRGINIDPRPNCMKEFARIRPEDINLEIGVAEKKGSATYFDFGADSGFNTISESYVDSLGTRDKIKNELIIETETLTAIFDTHLPKGTLIDFLSIDIEGMEEGALKSNDWNKYRPILIASEMYGHSMSDISESGVAKLLTSQGYEIFARVILSTPKISTVFFLDRAVDNEWR